MKRLVYDSVAWVVTAVTVCGYLRLWCLHDVSAIFEIGRVVSVMLRRLETYQVSIIEAMLRMCVGVASSYTCRPARSSGDVIV